MVLLKVISFVFNCNLVRCILMNKILAFFAIMVVSIVLTTSDAAATACGSANGGTFSSFPTSGLCQTDNNGNTPQTRNKSTSSTKYTWKCVFDYSDYYHEVSCSANRSTPPPTTSCGDGTKQSPNTAGQYEQCDDDNNTNADGCSSTCQNEIASIKIDKNDNDNGDDTQTVIIDGKATYKITVTNNGAVSLKNVVVNDSVSANCKRSAAQTKALYPGGTFDPNEVFTYTCEDVFADADVNRPLQSTASVIGTPVNNVANVSDSDPTNVTLKLGAPAISIDKTAKNGTDKQTVASGGTAKFKITVSNVGKVDLKDVVVTDIKEPSCNRSAAATKALYQTATLKPNKSFSYYCEDANVTVSYPNIAKVDAASVSGGGKVNASDPTTVTVEGGPAIKIDKNDADNGDDTQVVNGKKATYTIKVTNIGKVALKDVVVTDNVSANCSLTAAQSKALYKTANLEPGQSFTYKCTDTNVTKTHYSTASVVGVAVNNGVKVSDSNKTKVTVPNTPDPTPEPEPEPKKDKKCKGSIGNLVWNDKNDNGVQDAGEAGIPGVRVWLYKGNKVWKDVTNSQGRYKFKNLCSGKYRVVVKKEDIGSLYQVYDPDKKMDSRTKVRLKGSNDKHTKADFGYRGAIAPQTGAGLTLSILFAMLAAGGGVYYYRRKMIGIQ